MRGIVKGFERYSLRC